jgi:hypothetical protein
MEDHGRVGALLEYRVERWFGATMILAVWEGTPDCQMLDGLEVMQHKPAYRLLFQHLRGIAPEADLCPMEARAERQLRLPEVAREATLKTLFRDPALFTAEELLRPNQNQ